MEFIQEIKIPKERVAILIGKKGFIKKSLQSRLHIKLLIDSLTGLVTISGEDNLKVYEAKNVVQAIARGFNPDIAITLLDEDNIFESIDISEYSNNSRNKLLRLKSRAIGREGKAREIIEKLTDTNICIYGKTISIIGNVGNVPIARKGIEHLLRGSNHSNVYYWIEQQEKLYK